MRPFVFLSLLFPLLGSAQNTAGDELFDPDQVIEVHLTFAQPSYWDSLTSYYTEGLERQLMASVVLVDQMGTYTYDSVGVRLKGNSTYGLPLKKSMKIDFNEYVSGQKYHGLKKINLNNNFNDPTMLREKMFFEFSQQQGVLSPRVTFADLYMNGTLWGLYGVVEQVDKTFLERWIGDTNGNMFKAGDNFGGGPGGSNAAADLLWYGAQQSTYEPRYELKTNEDVNDWSDLLALIAMLNNSTTADLQANLPDQWEWAPMLRSLAIDNLFANLDSYINSARNYYIHHDSSTTKWNWIKWDANESFGRYSGGVSNLTSLAPNYVAGSRPLMTKIVNTPAFYAQYLEEYCTVFGSFSNAAMDARIDELADMIRPHVQADPNKQYTNAQFETGLETNVTGGGGPGGGQTIFGLKSFISARRSYLTGVLDCTSTGVTEEINGPHVSLLPNPCSDHLRVILPADKILKSVKLFDRTGRRMPAQVNGTLVDVSALAQGLYLLCGEASGEFFQVRFIKE